MGSKGKLTFALFVSSLFFFSGNSQVAKINHGSLTEEKPIPVTWGKPVHFTKQGKNFSALAFGNVLYEEEKAYLPFFYLTVRCRGGMRMYPVIDPVETIELSSEEETSIDKQFLSENFSVSEIDERVYEKNIYMFAKFIPLRINKLTGKTEKLLSYRLHWKQSNEPTGAGMKKAPSSFANSSVLASGKWCKLATNADGVYKVDHNFFGTLCNSMGLDIHAVDPRNIQLYGNGGELLSELNSDPHYDDLIENAIWFKGDTDGVFDNSDYFLFFGQSARKTKFNAGSSASMRYSSKKHWYSDSVYYFVTVAGAPGKRLQTQASLSAVPNYVTGSSDYFTFHESDNINLVKSGREWFGESFENQNSYSFNVNVPNLLNDTVWLKVDVAGRRVETGTLFTGAFDIYYPGGTYQITFPTTCANYDCDVAKGLSGTGAMNFIYGGGSTSVGITITRTYSDESGWLNYYWLNARRTLTMDGDQTLFMDYRSIAPGNISQFNFQSGLPNIRIWDVTDPFNVKIQSASFASNVYSFITNTDSLRKFIAFDGMNYKTPSFSCVVDTQNLHAMGLASAIDYVIIAHPWFINEAQQLANLHQQKEGYRFVIVTPDQIFNEFSSGAQDATGIKLFLRMLYKRTSPKYVLLYGDGSYNLRSRDPNTNTNFITTFQTLNSASFISSKTSDDYYGFLDDNEGYIDPNGHPGSGSAIDVGIGRLPVSSTSEAQQVLNKIVQYYSRKIPTSSCCDGVTANAEDWRNWVCLIADDANPGAIWETTFVTQSEFFASLIGANKRYNIDKIYEDSYQVLSVPGGRRYPDVVTAINNRVSRGALLMGYSGHGGELGLSHEEIVTINQIQDWSNINNMPLFFTATCEFSRFDDPARTSGGEYIILNPNGAGIGLFTTTRLAFASDGQSLGSTFYPTAVNRLSNGKYPALGDIIKKTKFLNPDFLHFALLGDPAVMLSYPKLETSTYKINTHVTQTGVNDTMSALGKYTVTGFISDTAGNKINTFNGTLYPTIFDKPITLSTLDNSGNGPSAIMSFQLQKNALYRGKASVVNGDFSFTTIVPKDIFYNFGNGKISYFAQTDTTDAAGAYTQLIVGGTSNNPITDNQGPAIKLFMNNNQFVTGGITNENPYIYAEISDSSGINTTGNGLGHDIVGTLDGNSAHSYDLNDYYQADVHKDSVNVGGVMKPNRFYQTGKVKYQISGLAEGTHHLNLKVWDILNNSSVNSTDFVVAKSAEVALAHVLNYPNPFTTSTKFFVEHNQACDYLNIEVQIFTITGHLVKTIQQSVRNEGYRTEGIAWDGRDDYGDKLGRGVYIYKVSVKNDKGMKADKIEKLVILN